jgi:hypothetical protein
MSARLQLPILEYVQAHDAPPFYVEETAGDKSETEGVALSYINPKADGRIRACDLRLFGALPKYLCPAPPAELI